MLCYLDKCSLTYINYINPPPRTHLELSDGAVSFSRTVQEVVILRALSAEMTQPFVWALLAKAAGDVM